MKYLVQGSCNNETWHTEFTCHTKQHADSASARLFSQGLHSRIVEVEDENKPKDEWVDENGCLTI